MKHREPTEPITRLPHHTFKPKHCAGTTCVHDHYVDTRPSLGFFKPFRAILERVA